MLGNVTLLERPLRVSTLMTAVRTALRARERQYQIREHLEQRSRAEESLRLADRRKDEFLATLGPRAAKPAGPAADGRSAVEDGGKRRSRRQPRQPGDGAPDQPPRQARGRFARGFAHYPRAHRGAAGAGGFGVRACTPPSTPAVLCWMPPRHQLSVDLPPEPIIVHGDSVRLTQVFANLLNNSAKYTRPGGQIGISLRKEGNRAVVSVRDNGIGIPAELLGSVFEMFTQVDRSSRQAQGGLGIGLTLVRSLVTMHGGTVEARSEGPGRGSEFIVSLPVLEVGVGRAREAPSPDVLSTAPDSHRGRQRGCGRHPRRSAGRPRRDG